MTCPHSLPLVEHSFSTALGEREKCGKSHRFAESLSTVFLADSFQVGTKPEFEVPLLSSRRVAWVCSFLGAFQVVKNLLDNSGDTSSIPESGRYPGEGNDNPL